MKKTPFKALLLILAVKGLTSCSSTSIVSENNYIPERPYSSILILSIQTKEEIKEFNEDFYNRNVKDVFSHIRELDFRKNLESAFQQSLKVNENFPMVERSTNLFKPFKDYDFNSFLKKYNEMGGTALLVVNRKDAWQTRRLSSEYGEYHIPNYLYFCYLIDKDDLSRIVWSGKVIAKGAPFDYEFLNSYVSGKITRDLRKNKYVY